MRAYIFQKWFPSDKIFIFSWGTSSRTIREPSDIIHRELGELRTFRYYTSSVKHWFGAQIRWIYILSYFWNIEIENPCPLPPSDFPGFCSTFLDMVDEWSLKRTNHRAYFSFLCNSDLGRRTFLHYRQCSKRQ